MNVKIEKTDGKTIVKIEGRLDTITAPEFDRETANITLPGETGDIELDCTDMEYISSAGLRSFISLLKKAKPAGRELKVTNLSQPIRQIFDMTGFTTLFKL